MPEAVEITTFRLADGVDMAAFIAANEDISVLLKTRTGFISRHICEREDAVVVHMLIWASVEDGNRTAAGIMSKMQSSPVHAAINQSTVYWSISAVRFALA
ncbi:hypothetical protein ACMDCR_24120 [Labrys okinawensis]|uniref:hypothetical protein n=1 Tax=Labrys okinawensis TaxID=346911 RepID=UPI0039BD5D47